MFSFVNRLAFDLMFGVQRMWLSHHDTDQLERCIVVKGRHVCRRCSVLYPIALAALVVVAFGLSLPTWLMFVLPIPAVAEFISETFGARYAPIRQMVLTAIAAPALGIGFARGVADPVLWKMVAVFVVPAVLAALARGWRDQRTTQRMRQQREENHPLLKGFGSAEEFQRYLESTAAAVQAAPSANEMITK
jgi:uncharacterized membrane protein